MTLQEKITVARKSKGLTQEELAGLASVTVRTIQRIESGESTPRGFTLKAISQALELPFENLSGGEKKQVLHTELFPFLKLLCLSCFSFLVIPYVHFLLPIYLLKRKKETDPETVLFARKLILSQIYWVIATVMAFLLVLAYNLFVAGYLHTSYFISYLWPFFFMYFINTLLILSKLRQVAKTSISVY